MTILGLIVSLVVIGVVLYVVQMIPMDQKIKTILNVVVVVCVCVWLLEQFGFLNSGILTARIHR